MKLHRGQLGIATTAETGVVDITPETAALLGPSLTVPVAAGRLGPCRERDSRFSAPRG